MVGILWPLAVTSGNFTARARSSLLQKMSAADDGVRAHFDPTSHSIDSFVLAQPVQSTLRFSRISLKISFDFIGGGG